MSTPVDLIQVFAFVAAFLGMWLAGHAWLKRKHVQSVEGRQFSQETTSAAPLDAARAVEFLKLVRPLIPVVRHRTELDDQHMRSELAKAGMAFPHAVELYHAAQVVLALSGCVIGCAVDLGWHGFGKTNLLGGLIGSCCGWLVPAIWLSRCQIRRQREIQSTLPDALELMAVAVEAGAGPDAAINDVSEHLKETSPALACEFGIYQKQLALGRSRRDSLHDLGLRCGVSEMSAMALTLIQSGRFGGAIAEALEDLANRMRIRLRQQAEERAQKLAFKLIFPLVLFIFPAVFVVLVGPAAVLIMRDMLALG